MNPTAEQLANRLNPTAVTYNVPSTDGLFRETNDFGTTIYKKTGNKIERINLVDLLVPQSERASIGNYGSQATVALQRLKSQYGLDWQSLPGYNIGDVNSQAGRDNFIVANKAGPDGGPDNYLHNYNGDITSFLGAKANSQASSVTVNSTPNTLSPLAQQPINNTNPTTTTMNNQLPSTNLQPGSTGEDVKKLQNYLVSQGLMTQEQVNTGYGTYGPQTTAAVKALQEKLGVNNSSGVGYFGPQTMAAIASASSATSSTGTEASNELQTILSNPGLSDDQKSLIQNLYDTVSTNDTANAEKIMAAFKAATEFSDPYFKAQTLIATDALSRALGATDGDLAFQEKKLRDTLSDLTATVSASKGQLDFNKQQELKKLSDSYTADLETTQQNLAATGKTSSSVRTKAEGLLAEQNQGLVESTNRQFSYQTGTLDRSLANSERDTAQSLTYLQDKATQDRIANLRKTEEQVGSTALSNLGYSGLLGNVGGSIPRQKTLDALSFTNSYVF